MGDNRSRSQPKNQNERAIVKTPASDVDSPQSATSSAETIASSVSTTGLPPTSNNLSIRQAKVVNLQKIHGNQHVQRILGKASNGSSGASHGSARVSASKSTNGASALKKTSASRNGQSGEATEKPLGEGLEGGGGGPKSFMPVPPTPPADNGDGGPPTRESAEHVSIGTNGSDQARKPAPPGELLSAVPRTDVVQRCPQCGKGDCGCKKDAVQRSPDPAPLDQKTQKKLEATTGQSLNGISVHENHPTVAGSDRIAETQGDHIYLSPEVPGPDTELGSQIRLHEAAHVLQSRQPGQPIDDIPEGQAVVESEAHEIAQSAQKGEKAQVQTTVDGRRRKGWEWPSLDDIAEMGEGALMSLVERVSSGLARLIREGPIGMLTDLIKKGVKSFIGSIAGAVDFDSIVSSIKSLLDAVMRQFDGTDDPENCGAFARALMKIRNLGQQLKQSAPFKALQSVLGKVRSFVDKAKKVILEPVFDVVKDIAGGVWGAIKSLASTIKGWFDSAKRIAGRVWNFVKGKLGFGDGESVTDWLKEKAKAAWDSIKETFAPIAGPLKTVGKVIIATNPTTWTIVAIRYLPEVLSAIEWLWANRNNPNIIRSARQQNHGTLAKLLSAGRSLGQGIASVADTIVSTVGKLSEALLSFLGAISGVPLLSMAKSLVQKASDGIKSLLDWAKSVFKKGANAVKQLFNRIKTAVKPYMDILMSVGLAVANPPMIPVILAGWAWRKLDDCYKPPIVDFLLDIVIGALEALPALPMLGPLWPISKNFVIGFLKGVKGQSDAMKIKVTNKIAKILSSPSIGFITGLVKGILTGLWEGLTDPFKLIYMVLKGLGALVTWAESIGAQAVEGFKSEPSPAASAGAVGGATGGAGAAPSANGSGGGVTSIISSRPPGSQSAQSPPSPGTGGGGAGSAPGNTPAPSHAGPSSSTPAAPPSAPAASQPVQEAGPSLAAETPIEQGPQMAGGSGKVEGERLSNKEIGELTESFRTFAGDIKGPAEDVATNFMPVMKESFKKSDGLSLDDLVKKLGNAWTSAMGAIQGVAADVAAKVFEFFASDEAESKIGESIGWLIGTVVFEVILGVLTAGTWTAASPIMRVISKFARVLDWTGEVLGIIFKGLGKIGSILFKGKGMLADLLSGAGAAAAKVLEPLEQLAKKFLNWADEMLAKFGGKAAKEAGEETVEKGAKKLTGEVAEESGEKAGKEAMEEAGEEVGEAAAEKTAKETAPASGKEVGETAGKEAGAGAGKPPKEGPPASSAGEFGEALTKGGPEAMAKGRKVMEEAGDIKALRKRVADGEFGDPEAAAKALFEARDQIIKEAQEKVSAKMAKDHPGITFEYSAPGTPKFTSDVDVRAIAKCEKRVELERLIKEGPPGDDALKALDDMGFPKTELDELKKMLKDGKLSDKDIGKYLSPEDVKREIKASLDASEAFYSKEVLGDADKVYDANFYTELRADDLMAKAGPAEKAKLLHEQSPVSMAEMKRNMSPEEWANYKQAQLDAMAKVDDAGGLDRLQKQFEEAERIAGDLEGKSLQEVKDELKKLLDDPAATPSQINEAMAKVKLMEPDAYGTDAAVKDIVDHLQTASRQSDKMKDAVEEAAKARGLDPERLKLGPDGKPIDPDYLALNESKLMDMERELREKFAKEMEDIAGLRSGVHGFEPGSAEHIAFLTQEASANMGKLFHAGTPSAQAKYLERIRYAAREAGVDVAGDITDKELRAMIVAKSAPNPDEAVDKALREWAERTGKTGSPADLRKAWDAETKKAASETVIDLRTFEQSEYQHKLLMEEIEGGGEAGAKTSGSAEEATPLEAPGTKSPDETPTMELPAAKPGEGAAELPGGKPPDEAAELPGAKPPDQQADLPGSTAPDEAPVKAATELDEVDLDQLGVGDIWRKTPPPPSGGKPVKVYRGVSQNVDNAAAEPIRPDMVDSGGYISRDPEAARDALFNYYDSNYDPATGGIIEIEIPADVWDEMVKKGHLLERPYPGYGGIDSSELRINTPEARELINNGTIKTMPAEKGASTSPGGETPTMELPAVKTGETPTVEMPAVKPETTPTVETPAVKPETSSTAESPKTTEVETAKGVEPDTTPDSTKILLDEPKSVSRQRLQHAYKHAHQLDMGFAKGGPIGGFKGSEWKRWKDTIADVLNGYEGKPFIDTIGKDSVTGYIKHIDGTPVCVFIYRDGPLAGELGTVVKAYPSQLTKAGL